MALFLSQMVDKAAPTTTNVQLPVLSFVFLALMFIVHTKSNQPMQPIQKTPRSAPSTWPPKWFIGSDPTYKILAYISPMLQLPYTSTVNLQICILPIDPVNLKKIQPEDIGTKSSTGPLLESHYSYICFTRYYPIPYNYNYRRLIINTLHMSYCPTAPYKYL